MHVNLLPQRARLRCLLRRRTRQWSGPLVGGVMLLLLAAAYRNAQLDHDAKTVLSLEEQCAPLADIQSQLIAMDGERPLLQPPAVLRAVSLRQPLPERILADIVRATRAAEHVQLRQCAMQDRQPVGMPAAGTASESSAAYTVTLAGVAEDEGAIAALMEALRGASGMAQVELKSVHEVEIAGRKRKDFQIHFEMRK